MPYELFEGDGSLSRLRDEWESLEGRTTHHVFQTYVYARRWQDTVGNPSRAIPLVVVLRERGQIIGLFPACRQRMYGVPVLTWLGAPHVLDYGDVLFDSRSAETDVQTFVDESLVMLRRRARGALLYLTNVRDDASCIDALRARLRILKQGSAPYIVTEGTHADYLASLGRSTRHGLRKIERRFDQAGNSECAVLSPGDPGIPPALDLIVEMQRKRFNSFRRRTILFDENYVHYRQEQANHDSHSVITTVALDGTLIAAALNVVYRDRMYSLMNSYDGAYSSYSPGRLLHARSVRLCFERGWSIYDFCWGDEAYKFAWTPNRTTLTTFVADNPTGALLSLVAAWLGRISDARRDRDSQPSIPGL